MKKGKLLLTIIVAIVVVAVVALFSVGIYDSLTTSGETYEANGITFQYPSSWVPANSVADGSIAAVADPEDQRTSVVVQQVPSEYGSDIQNACAFNDQYLSSSSNYINIQEVNSSIHNNSVVMHRYIINEDDGSQKEHVATWIKMNDSKIYVILLSTPIESYEQVRSGYDLIAGTFALIKDKEANSPLDSLENAVSKFLNN